MAKQIKETSKIFIKMGLQVGIKEPKRSHRGIIAKRYMNKVESYELSQFSDKLVKISFERKIKIKHGEEVYYL